MKNIFHIKIKAGALQYVLFIAVVIALLIFAFISLSYVQEEFKLKTNSYIQTIHNTNLAIDYSLKNELVYNESFKINLSENNNELTTVLKKPWGIFDHIATTSSINNQGFTKNALLGGFINNRNSLYLQDENQPLVVVGDTRIEGSVRLPKQGVKRGTIAGNYFIGNQLIYGAIGLSHNELPELKNREYLKQLCQGSYQFINSESLGLAENTTVTNSFNEQTKVLNINESINLRDIKLIGNIIIQSNSLIRIHESAKLIDVLLIAPKIEILDNVKGIFQAFASKEIIMGKSCVLNYPSNLTVFEKKAINPSPLNSNKEFNKIEIQSGSEIKGVVSFLSDTKENNFKPQILLDKGSSIKGEVYCDGNFELKGIVIGSVYTKGFVANQFGSVYQNHIYNGKILFNNFPEEFSGLFLNNSNQAVAKWLY